jgi:hypothetical protein
MEVEYAGKVGPVCGMPAEAIVTLAAMCATALSGTAFVLAVFAYFRAPGSRFVLRVTELVAIFLPFAVCGSFAAWYFSGA